MNSVKSIVVLTGAGISAESGIKTFRADDGLWENHRVEDVATPEAFERDPWLVQKFYNERRRPLLSTPLGSTPLGSTPLGSTPLGSTPLGSTPLGSTKGLEQQVHANPAHRALAKLEAEFDGDFLLVTQNIDNLHEQGGSKNIMHMHGEVLKMRCKHTGKVFDCFHDIQVADLCDCCGEANNLRPHIVWFGELPLYMDEIATAISSCDLFISIGTSGNVYPAAGFVQMANQAGAQTLEINLEESLVASDFDQAVYGKAGEVLPIWVSEFLADQRKK